MEHLDEKDQLYLEEKEVKSILFVGHDNEAEEIEGYINCIKSINFIQRLLDILEKNKESQFLDESMKNNILKILSYIRDNVDSISPSHRNLINISIGIINSTKGTKGVMDFYRTEFLRRNSDNISLTSKIPFLYKNIYFSNIKNEIDESVSMESDILKSLLFENEEYFIYEDTLDYIASHYFLDTLNTTIEENKDLFKYYDFKERALHVLNASIDVMNNKSELYEPSGMLTIPTSLLVRTKKTLNRVKKIK